jgi:hypothetical protein
MKYILLSFLLVNQPVYTDKDLCAEAARVINESYPEERAVCIPAPAVSFEQLEQENAFNNFYDLIIKLQNLPPKEVDKVEE